MRKNDGTVSRITTSVAAPESIAPKKETAQGYGKHLIIDAYGIPAAKLQDYDGLKQLLNFLPGYLGMSILHPAVVKKVQSPGYPDWGISGFVMIYESHLAFHTWPEIGYVSMDVYSCKDFDDQKVILYLQNLWEPKRVKLKVVTRKNFFK